MLAIYNAPIALETGGKSVARIEQRADGLRAQVRPLRLALGSVLSAWHRNILQLRHEKVSMPVLAIGADHSLGAKVGQQVQQYANHVIPIRVLIHLCVPKRRNFVSCDTGTRQNAS